MKEKQIKILNNPTVKLISIIILTLLLIMVSIILFEDMDLNSSMLIYNIYGTLILVSFLYSFHTTSKKLYIDLSLGVSRKDFYKKYLKNIIFVLIISLFFVAYYILAYKLIIGLNKPIFDEFRLQILIYLPIIFLSLSFLGFALGIVKMKRRFFYTIVFVVSVLVVISVMYLTIVYLFNIFLSVIVIGLAVFDYYLLKKINI